MEITRNESNILKGIAILLMVLLHLFARKDVGGLYEAAPYLNGVPLVYYVALLGDACRSIYMFVTGYAFYMMCGRAESMAVLFGKNIKRLAKLYVNFWIVFILFVPLGFLIGDRNVFAFDPVKLVMSFAGMANHYNGAWWFLQVYILFVLASPLLIRWIRSMHAIPLLLISGGMFVFFHFQKYQTIIDVGSGGVAQYFMTVAVNVGTTLLSFVIGALFAKHKVYSAIATRFGTIRYKNLLCVAGFAFVFIFHMQIESSIVAPFNAVIIICLFLLMNKSKPVVKALDYISRHSTNIWLTHMFFYSTIFSGITFAPKYPPLIFIWLILLCLLASYAIKAAANPLMRLIDNAPLPAGGGAAAKAG